MLKLLFLFLCATVITAKYKCNIKSASIILKRPTYEFSMNLLDRVVQDTDGHFVFSPISTWIQLLSLSEGARGVTAAELWNVTRYNRVKCFRRKWRMILSQLDSRLEPESKRKSFMIIDKFMGVKPYFVREIESFRSMQVLQLNFNYPERAADEANSRILSSTNGIISDTFSPDDFKSTVMLMADTSFYRNSWKIPFDPVYTKPEPFYSETGIKEGEVEMMNRVDYFNMTTINFIGAKILELPCGSDDRVSMLIFLPTSGNSIRDVYYNMIKIRLMSIFNKFRKEKLKLVNVKLPRFKISTDIDNIPELLYDMGLKRVFHPDLANLRGISDYKIYASLMTQIADIEVTEKGVKASVANFLLHNKISQDFTVNKPFAFMLVDKKFEIILFAGMYSEPDNKYF